MPIEFSNILEIRTIVFFQGKVLQYTKTKVKIIYLQYNGTQLFDLNSQDLCSDSSNRMTSLAGSGFKTEEDHMNIKIVTALLFIMHAHYLVIWKYVSQKQKLKIHPIEMATFKKYNLFIKMQKN